jgi:hypothetical protein
VRWARRTATIIAVATGLVPQLPAWHPPLTVAPPVLHRLPPPRSCSCRHRRHELGRGGAGGGCERPACDGRACSAAAARRPSVAVLSTLAAAPSRPTTSPSLHPPGGNFYSADHQPVRRPAQAQSVALELLTKPSLLFLDEPTSGLDPGLDRSVMHTLRKLADDDRTVVVTTHNVDEADSIGRGNSLIVKEVGGWERRGCRNWPLTPSRHSRRAACGDPALRRHGRHWAPTENDIPLAYAPLDAPTTLRRPCSSTAWVSTPRAPPAVVPGPVSRGVAGCDGPFRTRRPHPERSTAVDRRRAHRRLRGHRVLRRRHVCLPLLSCPPTCGRAATRAGRRTLGSWSRPTR